MLVAEEEEEDRGVLGRLVGVSGEEEDEVVVLASTMRNSVWISSRSGAEAKTCMVLSTTSGAKRIG